MACCTTTTEAIVPQTGKEGHTVRKDSYKGRAIGVFCSGGDAQGMNSAVRAVVRMGIYVGCRVYFIKEGYQGMVDGGSNIVEATWASVSGILQLGGTVIGSARCDDFRTREGRKKAAVNLVKYHITNLVVVGGDGSLTGANLFRQEWPSLLEDLEKESRLTHDDVVRCARLNIAGIVGSIDNDFCGTDMTIGADSALHRITEAVDAISTTAHSHQRCFVLEVMGRHCGYLALVSAIACEADYVFIPENPPEPGWQDRLCEKLSAARKLGQRLSILIVAEGAVERDLTPITADLVRKLIIDRLQFDTRTTVLGHVQRGGAPSAFDRVLALRMGAEAVLALMDAETSGTKEIPACVISLDANQAVRVPLVECVAATHAIQKAMANKNFEHTVHLRGKAFVNNFEIYRRLAKVNAPSALRAGSRLSIPSGNVYRFALLNVGAPCCGMNAVTRAFVRLALFDGHVPLIVNEGFDGLAEAGENIREMQWVDVTCWSGQGGSNVGTRRTTAVEAGLPRLAARVRELKINALLIVGGFEAFISGIQLFEARDKFPEFRIPMLVVPATISNNVPGTEFSLGADTSLNEIVGMCDRIKQSATGTKRRVFVVETMGGYCGYLATLAGLAGGADAAYIFEEKFTIQDLQSDVAHLRNKIAENVQRGLILRNELANDNYTTDFITKLYSEEATGVFTVRSNVLGHVQQGGVPSPFDRLYGTKMAARSLEFFEKLLSDPATVHHPNGLVELNTKESASLIGVIRRATTFTPLSDLKERTDFKHRLPRDEWWLKLRPLLRIMAMHDTSYESESVNLTGPEDNARRMEEHAKRLVSQPSVG